METIVLAPFHHASCFLTLSFRDLIRVRIIVKDAPKALYTITVTALTNVHGILTATVSGKLGEAVMLKDGQPQAGFVSPNECR